MDETQVENEGLISAPGSMELGGETYLISKPTERDVFAIFCHARKESKRLFNPLKEVCDACKGLDVTPEAKQQLLLQANAIKVAGQIPEDSISSYLISPAGAAFYFWILAKRNHPELTLATISKHITEENVLDIFVELDKASGADLVDQAFAYMRNQAFAQMGKEGTPTTPTVAQEGKEKPPDDFFPQP